MVENKLFLMIKKTYNFLNSDSELTSAAHYCNYNCDLKCNERQFKINSTR